MRRGDYENDSAEDHGGREKRAQRQRFSRKKPSEQHATTGFTNA